MDSDSGFIYTDTPKFVHVQGLNKNPTRSSACFALAQVKIRQSKKLSQTIAEYTRECDDVYDMAIMVKLAHPRTSTYDMINLIPGWRREFGLKGAARMHESATLQN